MRYFQVDIVVLFTPIGEKVKKKMYPHRDPPEFTPGALRNCVLEGNVQNGRKFSPGAKGRRAEAAKGFTGVWKGRE
jgi:hypothetical protein